MNVPGLRSPVKPEISNMTVFELKDGCGGEPELDASCWSVWHLRHLPPLIQRLNGESWLELQS